MARPTLLEIERSYRAACPLTDAELDEATAASGVAPCYRPGFRDDLKMIAGQLELAKRNREYNARMRRITGEAA